jgi:ABC-type lipoprotein export system ATPase subunit
MEERKVILKAENVIKQYRQYDTTVTAVNRANVEIYDGEMVAIIGSSGSGKSTFLHICAGLDRPNSGKIYVRGNDITAMSSDELGVFRGNYMGMVFQNHNLIPQFTAMENILIPTLMCNKPEHSYEEHFKKLVATLNIYDRLHHLPSELSGGQQQRVLLARALSATQRIILLDEPVSGLDPKVTAEMYALIEEINKGGITVIMISHDIAAAMKYATHVLYVGKEIFFGTRDEYAASESRGVHFASDGGAV